eukprot:m.24131 g.24131  ORF g.24131 m.24131 type:complete len:66 (-) comp5621_c0_seq1:1142-1339(-)
MMCAGVEYKVELYEENYYFKQMYTALHKTSLIQLNNTTKAKREGGEETNQLEEIKDRTSRLLYCS